jgi:hypothetical protein
LPIADRKLVGTPPVKTRSRNVPPNWIARIVSSRIPAVVDELSDSVMVMSPSLAEEPPSLDSCAIHIG